MDGRTGSRQPREAGSARCSTSWAASAAAPRSGLSRVDRSAEDISTFFSYIYTCMFIVQHYDCGKGAKVKRAFCEGIYMGQLKTTGTEEGINLHLS